jgi:DNA polymerase-3 subunit gamma/tau
VPLATCASLPSEGVTTKALTTNHASLGDKKSNAGVRKRETLPLAFPAWVRYRTYPVSYLVLARKYRPQSFEELVGQAHVARTLANAIGSGRVAHAFLFTGVRGVGKTTSARLLAKCLNCIGPDGKATGPTAIPCQVCAPCKEIAAGNDIDVQEIDGASYNGVDEVRRLQEGLAFRPARDRFKIYIVDEVHMLSNAAWNAFLKTLEEPPPHVKFIFATTEVHKVPVTILSRCQRYDFKLIGTQVIAERLKEVLKEEKIVSDELSIATLAREAAGSMRDAMSLLDQVIAFSGDKLSGDDVARVLGVAHRNILHQLAAALVRGDASDALRVVDGLAQQGFDLGHVAKDILAHLRNLVVAKVCGEDARSLLDLADEEVRDVTELAARTDADDLLRLFQGFSRGFDEIVRSGQPRAGLEMTLVRLARRPALLPLDELLARLGELEKRLAGGTPTPPRTGGPEGGARSSPPATRVASQAPPRTSSAQPVEMTRGSLALAREPLPDAEESITPTPPPTSATVATSHSAGPEIPTPAPRSIPTAALDSTPTSSQGASNQGATPPRRAPTSTPPVTARNDESPPPASSFPSSNLALWRAILDRVAAVRPPLASILEHAVPIELGPGQVTLGFPPNSFLGAQAAEAEALDLLTREVRAHFGAPTKVALDLSMRSSANATTLAVVSQETRRDALAKARAAVEAHPLVVDAVKLFGAELREVRLPPEE